MAQGNSGNGMWGAIAQGLLTVGANTIGRGGPKRQYKYNKKLAEFQNNINRENAQWAFDKELELRKYQADYDSPQAQMQRFKDAGLNPNLIYGNGSAAAGSFEAPNFPSVPGVSVGQVDAASLGSLGTDFNQARLMASQANLANTRTEESSTKQDLMRAQTDLTRANPYMKPEYVRAIVSQFESAAALKAQESSFMTSQVLGQDMTRGYQKMQLELDRIQQMLRLGEKDADLKTWEAHLKNQGFEIGQLERAKREFDVSVQRQKFEHDYSMRELDAFIKAEVISSKRFENILKEIEVKWMRDKDITPEHMRQFIMQLLRGMTK